MKIINITFQKSLSYLQKQDQQVNNEKGENDSVKSTLEKMQEAIEGTNFKSEDEKKAYEQKIYIKIQAGKKLSQSEMNYIRRTNPTMYLHVLKVQMQRENLERKLKCCKSKKEVEDVYNEAMGSISKEDPDKEALISAYNDVTKEFKKTNAYKALPRVIKEDEKEKQEKVIEEVKDIPADYNVIDKFDLSV